MGRTCGKHGMKKKRADAKKVEGKGRRGRPRKQQKDCIGRFMEGVGGKWRTAAKDRRSWRMLTENAERKIWSGEKSR